MWKSRARLNAPFKSGTWHGVSIEMQRFRQLNQCRVKWEQLQVETIHHNHILTPACLLSAKFHEPNGHISS